MNRFTVGRRTFQRTHVALSFAAKKQMSDEAPLATIKRRFDREETFPDLVAKMTTEVGGTLRTSRQSSSIDVPCLGVEGT